MSTQPRIIEVRKNVLKRNDEVARELRSRFQKAGLFVVSLVSSPGSGKTAFLEKTLTMLRQDGARPAALVGDLATDNDADRLARSGAPVRQITTGTMCHLEAAMIAAALGSWDLGELDYLFIENVGNLVCPASYDLGESLRLVLLSVTEGEDKPLKYPTIFNSSDLAVVTKMDLAEAVEFDWQTAHANIQSVRPGMPVIQVSSKKGTGMDEWIEMLKKHMQITKINAYRVELPLHEGSYKWSGGNSVEVFDSTVVEVHTDAGVSGYGEICPLGPAYLPAYAAGARTGIAEIAPRLIGLDPTQLHVINQAMDQAMRGHPYVKSALDMACWDILGKASGQPVATLLGGRFGDDFPLYRAISQESPEAMAKSVERYRSEGYTKFQLKVGGHPDTDIERIQAAAAKLKRDDVLIADANTGWTQHQALRVADGVRHTDVYIEQPCRHYEECLVVRRHTNRPFVLDEVVDGIHMVLRGHADQAMDVINLKISKVGGLTKARQIRDLCVSLGIAMTIEDTWGGDIVTAAIAALAHSTPPEMLFTATDFNSYVTVSIAEGAPQRKNGRMSASPAAGLGVQPRVEVLGSPVLSV